MPFKSQAQRGFMYANHPKMAEEFEKETPDKKLPEYVGKGYADGGVVMPDLGDVPIPGSSFDVGPSGSTTFKTAGNIPPPPVMAAAPAAMPALGGASASWAPNPAPARVPPSIPPSAMPSMGDVLAQAQAAGSQLYGNYSPDRRNELYATLLAGRNGMGNAMGAGLASVGDAIARGLGRDQTNFQDKTLQGQEEATKQGLDAFDTAQKSTLAATSAGMELQKLDPNSAASRIAKEAYAPLLAKLGYGPQAMARMSGANVEAVAKVAADYGGKEMENLFHQAQLIVESQFHGQELHQRDVEQKNKALEQLASHPIASLIPNATNAALKQQAGLTSGTTGQSTGPYGQEITKGGKTYEWSPITQKYHPK